jgi:cyclic pyranopterin phosphate synthase
MGNPLSHFDDQGRPRMTDVSGKPETERAAEARGRVQFDAEPFRRLRRDGVAKGDVLRVAELAGVMGAKNTAALIPLCHPLPLTSVCVEAAFCDEDYSVEIAARVKTTARTGVEMEALTAVAAACLTVYDMTKSIDKRIRIGPIELVEKSGGRSGEFRR